MKFHQTLFAAVFITLLVGCAVSPSVDTHSKPRQNSFSISISIKNLHPHFHTNSTFNPHPDSH